ncbi:MAG: antitoxin Xre/MbcA/ParS toxin-binding domain-containing protein [Cyanobium sp.]
MAALSDPTTELSSAGPALPCGAAEVNNQAEARDRLIQQVEQLLRESGQTEPFDAAAWIDRWLQRPNHALGGAAPELYLATPDGEALLSRLIGAMAAGSYL